MRFSNLLIQIALIFLFLLTACSNNQANINQSSKRQPPLAGEILVWVENPIALNDDQISQFKAMVNDNIRQFTQLHPNVKILVEFLPEKVKLTELLSQFNRGSGPDVFVGSFLVRYNELFELINQGYFQPINKDEIDLSQFRRESLRQVYYHGKIYALPVRLATQVLCYNKNKIKQLPTQLDDLIIQARQGYSVGLHSGFAQAFWGTGIFGGQLFNKSGQMILGKNQGWSNWMQWLKNARNEPNFFLINDSETLKTAFIEEKLAYITCSSGWLPYLMTSVGNDKLGITLLPGRENQRATPLLWTVSSIFNRASSANQHQIAVKMAQFLTNAEYQQQLQLAMPFLIPVNQNTIVNGQLFPMQKVLFEQSQTGVVLSLDQLEKYPAIFEYGELLYQRVLAGSVTPEQAAAQLNQTIND
ncbi:MAG TPA: ABC transporter substrate-binding protein [Cyanothece sp. UBA12306]|nr:ABC transporter substrate-binding protein [Cyanothece sp. UBA12306]